jgi:hypothetical protein
MFGPVVVVGDFACRNRARVRGRSTGRCVVSMRIERVPLELSRGRKVP